MFCRRKALALPVASSDSSTCDVFFGRHGMPPRSGVYRLAGLDLTLYELNFNWFQLKLKEHAWKAGAWN